MRTTSKSAGLDAAVGATEPRAVVNSGGSCVEQALFVATQAQGVLAQGVREFEETIAEVAERIRAAAYPLSETDGRDLVTRARAKGLISGDRRIQSPVAALVAIATAGSGLTESSASRIKTIIQHALTLGNTVHELAREHGGFWAIDSKRVSPGMRAPRLPRDFWSQVAGGQIAILFAVGGTVKYVLGEESKVTGLLLEAGYRARWVIDGKASDLSDPTSARVGPGAVEERPANATTEQVGTATSEGANGGAPVTAPKRLRAKLRATRKGLSADLTGLPLFDGVSSAF
ncbi:hypothetical protein J8J14_23415 [Roseomonas sp. SSH11]|uniref:Uncharacterized protein n=2 Tax=Pararoseomonas baculiformis TaxID=2820812 RepID=A0ABS4AL00_9PROT|nr:hypothetical protein [Pararoseomonas baculiformis]